MSKEKVTHYYHFTKDTEIFRLLSNLDEEERQKYIEGFDFLEDEVAEEIKDFLIKFKNLVYTNHENMIAKVTDFLDNRVEVCFTEM